MRTNNIHSSAKTKPAFTRLDLIALLASGLLLAAIALPVLANNRTRSEQVSCLSNLRQIGYAVHLWGNEHGERTPWFTPVSEGGTRGSSSPISSTAYFQIGSLSNELGTAKMLVCPSDIGVGAPRRMATDFSSTNANGGFFTIGYKGAALSYILGLHSQFELPRSLLSGDRNISYDGNNANCSIGLSPCLFLYSYPIRTSGSWTNAIHGESGNLLFTDGSAEEVSTPSFPRILGAQSQGDQAHHILAAP